ncbi:D-alanine-D-alanine ligase-like ATP-grasp enzyme [Paenibacillus forsythiae]|uniref:D-alanine-D-alanine ligase-like ATP-grasp enzyme n=1 Tax=Paenibacillus forsythiae TaxID=365616 RepID=A0ABU3H587_9BACL|nr:D-alanine-D-alanine ligase-like ATP-grasp enzyme [Paenibacillus forsythiae]
MAGKMKVGAVMGGISAEREISLRERGVPEHVR